MPYSTLELARAFIQAGELPDALDALNQHLTTTPDDPQARRLRAEINARMATSEHLESALADLQNLSEMTTDDVILQMNLLEKLNRTEEALQVAANAPYMTHQRLAEQYLHLLRSHQHHQKAMEIVRALQTASPDAWHWSQWAGDLSSDLNNHKQAIQHYSDALATIQKRYPIDTQSTAQVLASGNMGDAVSLTIEGIFARLLLARAEAHQHTEQWGLAEADYKAAAKLIPDDPVILFNLGVIAFRRGNPDNACALCQQALQKASPTLHNHMLASLQPAIYHPLRNRLTTPSS